MKSYKSHTCGNATIGDYIYVCSKCGRNYCESCIPRKDTLLGMQATCKCGNYHISDDVIGRIVAEPTDEEDISDDQGSEIEDRACDEGEDEPAESAPNSRRLSDKTSSAYDAYLYDHHTFDEHSREAYARNQEFYLWSIREDFEDSDRAKLSEYAFAVAFRAGRLAEREIQIAEAKRQEEDLKEKEKQAAEKHKEAEEEERKKAEEKERKRKELCYCPRCKSVIGSFHLFNIAAQAAYYRDHKCPNCGTPLKTNPNL